MAMSARARSSSRRGPLCALRRAAIVAALLLCPAMLRAAPIIVVGQHLLLADTPGQIIPVTILDEGAPVSFLGLNLYVQVGDGGPELADYGLPAGIDGPTISGVDLKPDGGLLSALADAPQALGGIDQSQSWAFVHTGDPADAPVALGLLAEIVIDTTGFFEGAWPLRLAEVLDYAALGGPFSTDLAGEPLTIVNGSITIPEPAGLTLLALAAAIAPRRIRRR